MTTISMIPLSTIGYSIEEFNNSLLVGNPTRFVRRPLVEDYVNAGLADALEQIPTVSPINDDEEAGYLVVFSGVVEKFFEEGDDWFVKFTEPVPHFNGHADQDVFQINMDTCIWFQE